MNIYNVDYILKGYISLVNLNFTSKVLNNYIECINHSV